MSMTPSLFSPGRSLKPDAVYSRATQTTRLRSLPAPGLGTGISSRSWTSSGVWRASVSRSGDVVLRPEAVRQRLLKLEQAISRLERGAIILSSARFQGLGRIVMSIDVE